MAATHPTATFAAALLAAIVFGSAAPTQAQQLPPARVIVTGEGEVTVAPDYAEITSGVTTRAKTAKEASDANSQQMAALDTALRNAGIAQNDIQTLRFSVAPVYGAPASNSTPKLVGYSVSNQVRVKVRQIAKVGEILDALIGAGATDAGSVQFLHSDASKALDQARQAAIADARRKAEIYAQSSGLKLGGVAWVTEEPAYAPQSPMIRMRAIATSAPTPISSGEDTLQVRITVGFEVAR